MWKMLFNRYHGKLGNIKARERENLWCVTEIVLLTLFYIHRLFYGRHGVVKRDREKKLDRKLLILGPALGNRQPQFGGAEQLLYY